MRLVLAAGEHDAGYVDAYYGPADWRQAAREQALSLKQIAARAGALIEALPPAPAGDGAAALRIRYLRTQLASLAAWSAARVSPGRRDFDAEARALYDTVPPVQPHASFDPVLAELDRLLPGDGALHRRVEDFQRGYEIPMERLDDVLTAAIDACRERTLKRLPLPENERFELEYVTGKPWSGYNWYQGNARSVIQINVDLPIRIDRAIDLGCHEGYPGHHTYNALLEAELVRGRGWVEFSVYPLFSPQSLIAEGSANYGIELAFPGRDRLRFEKSVLYPLAGLDPATADRYQQVQRIRGQLDFAGNQTARLYINGEIDRQEALRLLQKYGPSSRARAEQSLRFIETYGAYVINYNWGLKLVRDHVRAGTWTRGQRWRRFADLLASPRLPSALAGGD